MRIVVSGASGLLGSALVPALKTAGHDVVRLVRRPPEAADELEWDPASGTLDPAALAGADAVVCLSGVNIGRRWTARRKREILDSRLQTHGLLARTLAAVEPRPSVYLSAGATGIFGDRGDEILVETSTRGTGFLADVMRHKEEATEPARKVGVRVVNFRQGIILSKHGGALARMLPFFRLGVGGRVGDGKTWWSWVSRDDAVSAYLFALTSKLEGPVNLVSPNPARSAQFVKTLGRVLRRPTIFPLPAFGLKAIFGEMGEATLLEGQRVLPAKLLDAGFEFAYPELDRALERALSS